jgi:hypothetical protein
LSSRQLRSLDSPPETEKGASLFRIALPYRPVETATKGTSRSMVTTSEGDAVTKKPTALTRDLRRARLPHLSVIKARQAAERNDEMDEERGVVPDRDRSGQ